MVIGILALQGDVAEHGNVLDQLNVAWTEVRTTQDLAKCCGIILPGGESTTMMKLLKASGLDRELYHRIKSGMPVLATCAGAVLLSDSHLKLMDITVERNAYGSQTESFEANIDSEELGILQGMFIRAPKITRVGGDISLLAEYDGFPVLVAQNQMLVSTFHPEVAGEMALHRAFTDQVFSSQKAFQAV